MAVAMEQGPLRPPVAQRQAQAAGRLFLDQEALQKPRRGGDPGGLRARQQSRDLVLQGEEAGGLEPQERPPRGGGRQDRGDQAPGLGPGLLDQPGGEEGPPAAQRPAALGGLRDRDPVAAGPQQPEGGPGVLGLEVGVEGVGEEQDLAALPRR